MSIVTPKGSERKYEPYPEYKYSGVEWLGKIPAHWEVKKLKYLCSKFAIYGANAAADSYSESGIRFLRTSDIDDNGNLIDDNPVHIDPTSVQDYRLISGDLLVSRSGTIGRSFLYDNTQHGGCAYAGYLVRFVPNKKLVPKFAFYFTKSATFQDWLQVSVIQSTIGNVNGQKYANMPMPTAEVTEQQAIADFLDHETARIDDLIARKQRLIELLQEQRTALITHTVTKGLNPGVPMKDSGVEWLGEIPAHWEIKSVKRISKVFNGSTPKSSEPEYWDGDIPWVTPEDLGELASSEISGTKRYITQTGYESCGTNLVPTDSLILSTRAPIGHLAIAAAALCTNQGCRSLVPHSDMRTRFLYYVLYASRQELISLGQGSTFMELGKSKLETVVLPLPKTEEQQAIADYLDRETARIDSLIGRINQAIEKLQEYRSALITAAVTGIINVRQHLS